jgi:hypothetical protein
MRPARAARVLHANAPSESGDKLMTTETIVQSQVEAYNANDLNAFVACFAQDASLFDLATARVFAHGREQIRERYGKTFSRTPPVAVTIERRMVIGNVVIDVERIHGDNTQAVAIYRTHDGSISNLWLIPPSLVLSKL